MSGLVLTIIPLLVGGAGAVWDVLHRRLPNTLCLVFAGAALCAMLAQQGADVLAGAAAHAAIALIVGMILFRIGAIGGGDAKFYAAAALGVPLGQALPMLGWTSLAGFVLLVVMAISRRIAGQPVLTRGETAWSVPYGVAIFCGYAATTVTMAR